MTDECDPEYHRIDTYRILREQGMADAGLAKRMAIFTASECAEVAKKYQARIEELEEALFWLYGQVDQARDCGIYPKGSSMDEAMRNASKAIANVIERHALNFKGTDDHDG